MALKYVTFECYDLVGGIHKWVMHGITCNALDYDRGEAHMLAVSTAIGTAYFNPVRNVRVDESPANARLSLR